MGKEKESEPKIKSESKVSKKKVFLGIFVLLLIIVGIFTYLSFFKTAEIKDAYISKLTGNVEIDLGNGYIQAKLNQELFLNSKIRTNDGTAIIILQGKVISILEKGTEIEIGNLETNNLQLKQSSGKTWNKFRGIFGVDNFEVKTPNAVASVRSTEFEVSFIGDESSSIVVEGKVEFKDSQDNKILLNPYEKAKTINNTIKKVALSKVDLKRIKNKKKEILVVYKNQRLSLIYSNKLILKTLKRTYNFDENQIDGFLKRIDNGEVDARKLAKKSPIQTPLIEEILKINDMILEQNKEIEELDLKINDATN